MANAPAWLVYASFAVSVLALVGHAISFATYRRAGARVKASFTWKELAGDLELRVKVANSGLAEVKISELWLTLGMYSILVPLASLSNDAAYDGVALPHRLRGLDDESWTFSVREAVKCSADKGISELSLISPWKILGMALRSFGFSAMIPGVVVTVLLGNGDEVRTSPGPLALRRLYQMRESLGLLRLRA